MARVIFLKGIEEELTRALVDPVTIGEKTEGDVTVEELKAAGN